MKFSTDTAAIGAGTLFDRLAYHDLIKSFAPRVITQIDRDPASPTYGSCDRGFWMYRLHDFDSGVLQQTSLGLAGVAALVRNQVVPDWNYADLPAEYFEELARAVNRRSVVLMESSGYMDEYYPGEQSFPGTTFAAYSILKSAQMLQDSFIIEHPALEKIANSFLQLVPSAAANQDAAAAAFLALFSKSRQWRSEEASDKVEELLAGQDGSFRFIEYGGGDLGYATVSLNFLASMGDDQSHDISRPLAGLSRFIADFVSPSGRLGGEYASRSTTYFLPFGLVYAGLNIPDCGPSLARLNVTDAFEKLDDRYLSHYCFPALVRASALLETSKISPPPPNAEANPLRLANHAAHGLAAVHAGQSAMFVGVVKGGSYQIEVGAEVTIDSGYRLEREGLVYATCVDDPASRVSWEEDETQWSLSVSCAFQRYNQLVASKWKTVALRLLSALGPRLNQYFKKRLIKNAQALPGVRLNRTFTIDRASNAVVVEDQIEGLRPSDSLTTAPAASMRLVPSAKFFQAGEAAAHSAALTAEPTFRRSYQLS